MSIKKINKTVLITGATGGIGKAISKHFASAGFNTILVSRSRKDLTKLQKEINNTAGKSIAIVADVSDEAGLNKKLANIKNVDVLINTAGIQGPIGKFTDNNYKDWTETIKINLLGTVQAAKVMLPKMKKGASIINFSGGGALTPRQNFSAYAVAKTGVVRFTEILAKELTGKGIRVNAVSPGGINTHMFRVMLKAGAKKVGKEEWQSLVKQKESGGGDPRKVAELCLWLSSGKSAPLSGKTISAVYDDWQKWDSEKIKKIVGSDWYTLRRFDPYMINKLPKI